MPRGGHSDHKTNVIVSHRGHTIRKLLIASMHWKLSSTHELLCWVCAFSTVMCLHRVAYMLPLSVKAHSTRGCIYAYGQPGEVKQAERSLWTFSSDISIVL